MLKCGQKNNIKYTFGLRKEQKEEMKKDSMISIIYCPSCGVTCKNGSNFCHSCGTKL